MGLAVEFVSFTFLHTYNHTLREAFFQPFATVAPRISQSPAIPGFISDGGPSTGVSPSGSSLKFLHFCTSRRAVFTACVIVGSPTRRSLHKLGIRVSGPTRCFGNGYGVLR